MRCYIRNPNACPDATIGLLLVCPNEMTSETTKAKLCCLRTHAPKCNLHARSTVDSENLAVDPLAILGGKETDNTGDVDGETDTVERRPASSELLKAI